MSPLDLLPRAAALLGRFADVLAQRVRGDAPPAWLEARGWAAALGGLSDEVLVRLEAGESELLLEDPSAPADLRGLVGDLRALRRDLEGETPSGCGPAPRLLGASPRKAVQVQALVRLCQERFAACRRVLDVGAGRGALTREVARALGVPAVGLEQDPARVATACALGSGAGVSFQAGRIGSQLELEEGDLVLGLHACGALGDALVQACARRRTPLLLLGCCLQRVEGAERPALSAVGRGLGLNLSRGVLALANYLPRSRTLVGEAEEVMRVRGDRRALRLLMAEAGVPEQGLSAMRRLDRLLAREPLEQVAARATGAPPSAAALARAERQARRELGQARRWALPRSLLARAVELAVALDRACLLLEAGAEAEVRALFPVEISPRNLAIVSGAMLPSLMCG